MIDIRRYHPSDKKAVCNILQISSDYEGDNVYDKDILVEYVGMDQVTKEVIAIWKNSKINLTGS